MRKSRFNGWSARGKTVETVLITAAFITGLKPGFNGNGDKFAPDFIFNI